MDILNKLEDDQILTLIGLFLFIVLISVSAFYRKRQDSIFIYLKNIGQTENVFRPKFRTFQIQIVGLLLGSAIIAYYISSQGFSYRFFIAIADIGLFLITFIFMIHILTTSHHVRITKNHIEFSTSFAKDIRKINWNDIESAVYSTNDYTVYFRQVSDPEFEKKIRIGAFQEDHQDKILTMIKKYASDYGLKIGVQTSRRTDGNIQHYL